MEVEMPGVPKESLSIDIKNDTLVIHGSRPGRASTGTSSTMSPEPEKNEVEGGDNVGGGNIKVTREHARETEGGPKVEGEESKPVIYEVKFRLHGRSDVDGIRADYHDGLLKICVPHRKETAPRSISITA
jgi:HSP20 family molecular chaperone IbpA